MKWEERGFEMVGITSYGACIPWYRISRKTIYSAMGWLNPATFLPGEKAVANWDEDSITMAVNASVDCLNEVDRNIIDGVYFGSVTLPYKERLNAGIIATVLDLRPDIKSADFAGSTKAGTAALLSACDAVKAGSAKSIMVCASDCRIGKAGSSQEEAYGDGAAAFLLSDSNVVASLEGFYSISYDFMDHWRGEYDRFDRTWEDRWAREEGYAKFIPEAIQGLAKKYDLKLKDFAKVVYPCLYTRVHAGIAKKLGLGPDQIQPHMFDTVGNTGTAYPLMMFVAALEDAKPGDKILVVSFGNGSDALFFEVTDQIENIKDKRRGVKGHLNLKQELDSYEKYAAFRNIIPIERGIRGEEVFSTQISMLWRDRRMVLALHGSKCKRCGTPQYPPQRVCVNPDCGAIDEMEDYRFSDKKGRLFTYTGDSLAFSPNPPALYGVVDFEGGGRYWFDITDCDLDSLKVGMPVEMSFRRRYLDETRGISGYFWKAVPIRVE